MTIRPSTLDDIPSIMSLYAAARAFMRSTGNVEQWVNGYPQQSLIEQDIAQGVHYLCLIGSQPAACFTLIAGHDPTYQVIDGQWLNDQPYATLHRIASDGRHHGLLHAILQWSFRQCPNLRIDTHAANRPMRHLLAKEAFHPCGIIHVADGTPRIAYQKIVA